MKVLIAGWFSFEEMGATAGDLIAAGLVREWLLDAGYQQVSTALAPPFGDVAWAAHHPDDLDLVVFVCGPFGNGSPITEFIQHFAGCRLVGVDLTMLEPVADWNPFDLLLERDSERIGRPDITFAGPISTVPVIGVVKVHPQEEYGDRARHLEADQAIEELLEHVDGARIEIDTRLDRNATGLRTPQEVEALIARCDVVVTTRLHGTVLALKNSVPALVIDPIAGGGKVIRQSRSVGWPYAFTVDELRELDLPSIFEELLAEPARELAARCAETARERVRSIRQQLIDGVRPGL